LTRGDGAVIDDLKCAKCAGEIKFWDDVAANKQALSVHGFCSWCCAMTAHQSDMKDTVFRNTFRCSDCSGRTLKCIKCKKNMARGGQGRDDIVCVQCKPLGNWEPLAAKKAYVYRRAQTVEELVLILHRPTEFHRHALEARLLRPFLMLATMVPPLRNQVAISLGWTLIESETFGDPLAEAWELLTKPIIGLVARSLKMWEKMKRKADKGACESVHWEHIVFRICQHLSDADVARATGASGSAPAASAGVSNMPEENLSPADGDVSWEMLASASAVEASGAADEATAELSLLVHLAKLNTREMKVARRSTHARAHV
jgi:hypothetical protein